MKRNRFLPAVIVTSLLILTWAGQKSTNDNNSGTKTKTDLLVQNTWKFDNVKVAGVDASSYLEDCDKDNVLTFVNNGAGTADEGATKCDAADPQTVPFTWAFQNSETELKADVPLFPLGNDTFTLVSLTETQLVVSQDIDIFGSTQNAVITFKK
jgi:hypothetical protein